jgi:hypothetical protein
VKLRAKSHVWLLPHKLTMQALQRCIVKKLIPYIEDYARPIFFFKLYNLARKQHFWGLDLGKISVCGSKMETECPHVNSMFFRF